MTAPVISSEKIEMTTPVISEENSFSFVMPQKYKPEEIPEPLGLAEIAVRILMVFALLGRPKAQFFSNLIKLDYDKRLLRTQSTPPVFS